MAGKPDIDFIGSEIAGSLIAVALFRTLVEKGLLTTDEARGVLSRATSAVKDSTIPAERAAVDVLAGLMDQLRT